MIGRHRHLDVRALTRCIQRFDNDSAGHARRDHAVKARAHALVKTAPRRSIAARP
jgi:hypothetical protein